ncbi:LOW QUALITY PROTEIN: insulin receptor substrate 1-like [Hemitrygon akajei]|uniref:LOW QUALITY PROTEIN: insulin receptor substrate 1-like n=1 Tax=Hemitrygon akajei TaxID=2704970 RepID=UPI003BFA245B
MANPAEDCLDGDVRKCGNLRKCKSLHRRYFVLRAASERGAARLEYYESEKKFRRGGAGPKRALPLHSCFNVNKRADSRSKYLLAIYTRDECFSVAADSPQEQDSWYQAIVELLAPGTVPNIFFKKIARRFGPSGTGTPPTASPPPRTLNPSAAPAHFGAHITHSNSQIFPPSRKGHVENGDSNYSVAPGPAFKEVWQVNLRPRGLGQSRNMSGIYRLCLTEKTINLVKLNSDAAAVVLQLMNIRRCGHSDNFFFVEVGRSAVTGPGEFWMQVDDSVVAQNMHETILEAMKAMSEEFRLRSKSQSSSSNPISVPTRQGYHLANLPPSQVGFSTRRSNTTSPAQRSNSARARTSSDGSGASSSSSSSRPASADEVPASPSPGAGLVPSRQGMNKAHPPLGQTRSTPDPYSRRSPCATGLVFGLTADRGLSSPSASSSPPSSSDGEGGVRLQPCALPTGWPSPGLRGAVQAGSLRQVPCRGQVLRRACSQGEEEVGERGPSKQALAGKGNWRTSRTPEPAERACKDVVDNGYMAMLPGVVPLRAREGDYVAMNPKGASAPQQILGPQPDDRCGGGYMLMSPSGSCSPEDWSRAIDRKLGLGDGVGDYMNMSPGSRSASSTPPESPHAPIPPRVEQGELPDTSRHGFRSLPRSYKQPAPCSQLSCSSSYSTGGSSDSLGEVEGRRLSSVSASGQQAHRLGRKGGCRPTGLSIDVAKANTLPRRRESPEPQSPGEYVCIEFRAETRTTRALPSPGCRAGVFQHLPAAASEYVNVEPSKAPARGSHRQPFSQKHPGARRCVGTEPRLPPRSQSDPRRSSGGGDATAPETFLPTSPAPPPPVPSADHVKRCGSASFENVWPVEECRGRSAAEEPCTGMSRHMSIGFENGLNYIDLDLGTDSSQAEPSTAQQRLYAQVNSSPVLNAYASIDFHKSEELRSHKSNKEVSCCRKVNRFIDICR